MKNYLSILLFTVLFISCEKEEPRPVKRDKFYAVSVYAPDKTNFTGKIKWGLDQIQSTEVITNQPSWGAGIRFEKGQILFIQFECNRALKTEIIDTDTNKKIEFLLPANTLHKIDVQKLLL